MAIDFSKYDKMVDLEGLQADVKEAMENGGEFKDAPHGTYEVQIEKLELGMSKSDKPMIKIWYKILEGEYKNNKIFHNQLVDTGQKIHIAKQLLDSFSEDEKPIEFETYQQYAEDIDELKKYIDDNKLEYSLEYSKNKNGYDTYRILEVFEG